MCPTQSEHTFFVRKMYRMTNISDTSKITWRQRYLWRHLHWNFFKINCYWKLNSLAKKWGVNHLYPNCGSYFLIISMRAVFAEKSWGNMPVSTGKMVTSIKNADVIGNLCIKLKSNIVVLHYGLVFWRDWGIWRDFTKEGQFYPPPLCGIWDPK